MAEAIVGATVDVLLQNLIAFSVEEIGLIWNLKKDLQNLKDSVATIRDFLEDAEMKQVTDKPVQRWLMKLEALAFDADYVFDQLNYQLLHNKVQRGSKKKVRCFFPNCKSFAFRHRMARKIKNIQDELKSINQKALELGLQARMASAPARGARADAQAYLETDSFSMDPVFVGRENDVVKLVKMVTSNSSAEQLVSVLPIVGMGGSGKTTLTRKVYNDPTIISHFGKRIWVHVSDNDFNPVTVLKSVVASSTGENVDGSREVVLQKLRNSLEDKKYLLVLDNVWNESNEKWVNFHCTDLTYFPCELLESCVPSLEVLSLAGSERLTNLPQVITIAQRMARLRVLAIERVPKFNDVAAEIGSLRSLQSLDIGGSKDCPDYVSFKESLDRCSTVFRSVHYLTLDGMQHWDALPDHLQHLTAVHGLILSNFGIEVLPEWLENLSSLEKLYLFNFLKLRRLPSKKAMEGLTKLIVLEIINCPLLQQTSNDSEWSKISHIPDVKVDGHPIQHRVQALQAQ